MSESISLPLNRVCVVVGVGEGLGKALARRFAAGYKVALVARSAGVIESTAGEIKAAGGVALPVQSDATIEAEIAAAYERITRELGPIEILIYNGGRRPMGRLLETTAEVFEQTWRLHTLGAFLWARHFLHNLEAMTSRFESCGAYLFGDRLSTADILLMTCLDWAASIEVPLSETFSHYRQRLGQRPAYKAALKRNFAP
jgi:NAD(P)-dependent dehydrogenase (short-subunit alcohol dehydrogenase family)